MSLAGQSTGLIAASSKPQLYSYQAQIRRDLYEKIRIGKKKILVFAPTGAGKTVVSAQIVADAVSKGRRVLFMVDLDVLIPQTWQKFKEFGLDCGFIKAGWAENRTALVQIASAQTLPRRSWWRSYDPEVVLLDECHKTAWKAVTQNMMNIDCPNAIYIGLTATPWRLSKRQGMGDIFEALVCAPMPYQLMDMGFLVKPVCYGIKGANLDDVRTMDGDYIEGDLGIVCNTSEVVNTIVSEWQRLAAGRRTIAFAVNVAHSKAIAAAFCAANIPAEHVDGTLTSNQRAAIYERLRTGKTLVLSSCGVLQEGFDVPSVECVALCRPTKSRALYFQQVGRGLRISPATQKTDCLVLDQALNVKRHGFVEMLKRITLTNGDDTPPGEAPIKTCPECGFMMHTSLPVCPECGYEFPKKPKYIPAERLYLMLSKDDQPKFKWFREQFKAGYLRLYLPGWAAKRYEDKYGCCPPYDWCKHAIFGDSPRREDQRIYYEHLVRLAKKNNEPQNWVTNWWQLEFGVGRLPIEHTACPLE